MGFCMSKKLSRDITTNKTVKTKSSTMPIDFYYLPLSPPCRAAMLLAKAVGVHLNLKTVDVLKGEQMSPEFLKINPQHTIPTLNDNGFVLWESRCIMGYLVDKYAKDDSLYPKDPRARAIVDQRLYFDIGTLNESLTKCYYPVLTGKTKVIDEENIKDLENAFETLDMFLDGRRFAASVNLTIADFSIVVTVSTAESFGFDVGRYDNVAAWYENCKKALERFDYEEINAKSAKKFGDIYKSRLEKMPIDLYHVPGSAPCRTVRLVAAAVGVDLNLKFLDLMNGEHLKPEFIKMNPQHTIPTIDDNGFYLWESRAILGYLVDQYGKDDSLYPKDPKKRAMVNQRLFFDIGTLYQVIVDAIYPTIFGGAPKDSALSQKIDKPMEFLEIFLEGQNYVAGDKLTIADIALIVTVSNFEVVNYDYNKFKNISRWFARVKAEIPKYEEINGEGLRAFKALAESLSKKIMNLDFYYAPTSSPCRAVMLTAEAIGVTLNLKSIDVMAGEHLNSKYEQINPQKTVPCLVDGDLTLTESRAIMAYLVDQYGKNTRLYPKMVNSRALVNQRLYFDIGTFHKAMAACYYPILFGKWKTYQSEHYDNLKKAFEILDKFLEGQDYVAGRSLTIADLSLVASVTTAEAFGFDFAKFRNVTRWLKKVKTFAPGYRKANGEGAESMKKLIERVMTQIDEL
ncbi:uncharacterized protein LOC107273071 [Cephus cinctus]|uniref:Uncharacterized protein LOC107273071 n=3 Tax=Cephus cinctus TaxID=211228 RepID=A0AAJ7RSA4_CEPCN|nr:uncharacterized protein LOC107273071 [Cephus cinctus]